MKQYKFINPYIDGQFKNVFDGSNQLDAAHNAWRSLSTHFTNNVPKFAFTLEGMNDGKLSHFLVEENVENNKVNFSISELNMGNKKKEEDALKKKVREVQQDKSMTGGRSRHRRRHRDREEEDDDDTTTTSTSDYYKFNKNMPPISYWWYNPYMYQNYLKNLYMPTFTAPLTPYVEIMLEQPLYG